MADKELSEAEAIGRMIRTIREREGLTQAAWAKLAKCPQAHLSRLETGADGCPQLPRVKNVLAAIGYTLMLTARKTATEYELTL